jgi:type II secretory pathway component PulM
VKISAREKRFLIGGAILAVLVLLYYLSPLILPQDLSATVEAKKALLQKQRELISMEDSIKTRIAADQKRLAGDMNRLLPGDTPAQAGAALVKILQNLADTSQVELTRKTNQPDQKLPESLTKVTIQLETNCNIEQLVRFLVAIQNYEKFLKVDELFISSYPMQKKYEIRNPSMKVSGFIASPPEAKPGEKAAEK